VPHEVDEKGSNKDILDRYLILHSAKLTLSLIDASSGKYFGHEKGEKARFQRNEFMNIILRQDVQNQLYYEELELNQSI